ncbi:MAG: hypothetical protein ACLUIR_03255 [Faecalibacterium prausnitzii]
MSAAQSACAVPGASSVSNDGYSVTFASGALSERLCSGSAEHPLQRAGQRPSRPAVSGVLLMQCSVTVVNLIHDSATETDRPVCHVIPGCSWRRSWTLRRRPPANGAHPAAPAAGYLPYFQWAKLPPGERRHTGRSRGGKPICGAVRSLTEAEYAALEKTHICCTVAAVSDNGNCCCRIFM